MDAYDAERWHDFFVMIGGAAAALAGLLFVAVSFNGRRILGSRTLRWVAARSLNTVLFVVVAAALGLAPQPTVALGIELMVLGAVMVVVIAVTTIRGSRGSAPAIPVLPDVSLAVASSVPMVLAGAFVSARIAGGLFWLLAECVIALVTGAILAWILLVEIRTTGG